MLKENLVRGHVELTLSVDRTAQQKAGYNRELVAGYLDAFKQARDEFALEGRARPERGSCACPAHCRPKTAATAKKTLPR